MVSALHNLHLSLRFIEQGGDGRNDTLFKCHCGLQYFIRAADLAGLPFLAEAGSCLHEEELMEHPRSFNRFKGRTGKTHSRIVEDGSMLWMLISLFGLTYTTSTKAGLFINVVSIFFSFVGLSECCADLASRNWRWSAGDPSSMWWVFKASMWWVFKAFSLCGLVMWMLVNMIRFAGAIVCSTHTLQLQGGLHCARA